MIEILSENAHPRGRMYSVSVEGKECQVLVTHHALGRLGRWGLEVESVIKALLKPNEVVTGHHSRFIAHRPTNEHLIRIIYEYDEGIPVVVTVYRPKKERYYRGGGIYEDRVLRRC